MRFKDSILSRLFHTDSGEDETEQAVIHDRTERSGSDDPEPDRMELYPDNALYQLWQLYYEQGGAPAVPVLCAEGTPDLNGILSDQEKKRELSRVMTSVVTAAKARLAQIVPKKEDERISDADAKVEVFLSAEQLTAWIMVYPPAGRGREVDEDMLEQALQKSDVTFGIERETLRSLPDNPRRYSRLFLAAKGVRQINGTDGQVVDLFPRSVKPTAKVNESGQVDYTELQLFHTVEKGEVICQIIQPTLGVPGTTVSNKKIAAVDGKKAVVPQGRNTELSKDGTTLIASVAGRVEFSGRSFQVKSVLDIKGNVDYSTGNIDFLGDVHISGDVCNGFIVRATGDIVVDGVIEACTLEGGGNIVIGKGVKGDNKATVRACRSIYAKYLESSKVCAKENVQTECIINCNVYSDGAVSVNSGRGMIIGGKIRASHEVSANIAGSRAECHTVICLGGLPSEEFEYENLQEEVRELELAYEKLEQQPDDPAKLRNLPMVRMKLSVDRTKLKQFAKYMDEKERELLKRDSTDGRDDRRFTCKAAYPGTEIVIDSAFLRLDREVRLCTAVLADGEIRLV